MSTAIEGRGTDEQVWLPWLDGQPWPALDLDSLSGRRVVVLAAHPDDEVLGVGALLSALAGQGHDVVAVWASDGEASHPGSTAVPPDQLRALRRAESVAALGRLGVHPVESHHLGLPDSGLGEVADALRAALTAVVDPADVVLAPWRGDGHPDHEVVGEVAAGLGARLVEYPIWMWHWAAPDDDRVPWDRMMTVPVADVARKAFAVDAFDTQVRPLGPAEADAAILPPHVVRRFLRGHEVVIV